MKWEKLANETKEKVTMALIKQKSANHVSKVKGPIRCHTCQLKCLDAEHYLSHICKPISSPSLTRLPISR